MPKLLLINPSNDHKGLGNVTGTAWPPLSLPYIAALTPPEYEISVIDENIRPFEFRPADIVGITAYTASAPRAYEIAAEYRARGIPVVMGGIHASMVPEEAGRYCDAVVVGEAESVWATVLADFEAGRLGKRYEGARRPLDDLPIPRRDILKNEHYGWGSIQTSRGCPMNCSFCSVTAFNGRTFRRRPLDSVMAELAQIPQRRVLLADDNLIGFGTEDRDWTRSFFEAVIRSGIRKTFFAQASLEFGEDPGLIRLAARAGLRIVFIGMESVQPESLEAFHKSVNLKELARERYHELIARIRKGGIAVLGAFVLGCDTDDPGVFPRTLEFIRSSGIDVIQVTKPTPLPGTELWNSLDGEGRILSKNFPGDWTEYRFTKMLYTPLRMSVEQVYEGFTWLRGEYYGAAPTLARTVSTLWTTKSPIAALLSYKFNASYRKAFHESEHFRRLWSPSLRRDFRELGRRPPRGTPTGEETSRSLIPEA